MGETILAIVAIVAAVVLPLVWWGGVANELVAIRRALDAPAPERPACTWEDLGVDADCSNLASGLLDLPALADVYLARRSWHRAHLFPTVFEPVPPVIAPLEGPLAPLVHSDYERLLVSQVLRDAGQHLSDDAEEGRPAAWFGRDPVMGVPLGGPLPNDHTVMQRVALYQPDLPPLPDHRTSTRWALLHHDVVRETTRGFGVVGPVALAHLADRAANDVRFYAALRVQALERALDQHHAEAMAAHLAQREVLEEQATAWRAHRRAGLPGVIGSWGFAVLLVVPLRWARQRELAVSLDLHSITIGIHRILWESLDELTWSQNKVFWRCDNGSEGEIGELVLSDHNRRILDRTSQAMWLHERGAPPEETHKAIRRLLDEGRRST